MQPVLLQQIRVNLTQKITNQFLGLQIPEAIWGRYFVGRKMHGIVDLVFLGHINSTIACLMGAIFSHALRAWQTGVYRIRAT